jgi:hypothetical protein
MIWLLNRIHRLLGLLPTAYYCLMTTLVRYFTLSEVIAISDTHEGLAKGLTFIFMYFLTYVLGKLQMALFLSLSLRTYNMVWAALEALSVQGKLRHIWKSIKSTEEGRSPFVQQFGMFPRLKMWILEFAGCWIFVFSLGPFFPWGGIINDGSNFGKIPETPWFWFFTGWVSLAVLFFVDWQKWLVWTATAMRPTYSERLSNSHVIGQMWNAWDKVAGSGEKGPDLSDLDAPRDEYQYLRQLEKNEIRLLKLDQWNPKMRVSCTLVYTSLKEHPPYEAISHRWSDSTQRRTILIENKLFKVPPSVFKILEDHSFVHASRFLWIDTICINQEDNAERETQVQQMQRIFQQAEQVIVCLEDFERSGTVAVWCDFMAIMRLFMSAQTFLRLFTNAFEEAGAWAAFRELLKASYFSRVWIVQEIAMAKRVRVKLGGLYISWWCIITLFDLLENTGGPPIGTALNYLYPMDHASRTNVLWEVVERSHEILNGRVMAMFQALVRSKTKLDLTFVVRQCWAYQATDPRDKIYALLGLAHRDEDDPLLRVSYDESNRVEDVFKNAAKYMYTRENASIFLNDSGIGYRRNIKNLASWVPDWTGGRENRWHGDGDSEKAKASGNLSSKITLGGDGDSIIVEGIQVGKIKYVGPVHTGDTTSNAISEPNPLFEDQAIGANWLSGAAAFFRMLRNWFISGQETVEKMVPEPYPTGEPRMKALWHCVTPKKQGIDRPHNYHPEEWDDVLEALELLTQSLIHSSKSTFPYDKLGIKIAEDGKPDPESLRMCQEKILLVVSDLGMFVDCRFCVTDGGYLGVAPAGTAIDDLLVVVFGVSSPCFVRFCSGCDEIKASHPCYHHIGVGFVYGMMNGEMVEDVSSGQKFALY